ncbi:ABC transporter permease [Actinomycetospora straminea]|uniref:ABC transporter permease n=1 Tax=Actinomycetospora straminea TaxID=663607 RepID=A0ABP9E7R2_9PSEU|nr:ABC transporter permease [Actinomycetospora straminea]MDD7932662.1 ABC transporter permease [Actinomycetospora straminea]
MSTATTETVDAQAEAAVEEGEKREQTRLAALWSQHYDLVILPAIIVLLLVFLFLYVGTRQLDTIEQRVLAPANVGGLLWQQILLAGASTVLVLLIAVPLGIALSRRGARRVQGPVLAVGGFAQALPPFGVLLLMAFWLDFGFTTAVVGLTIAALLPVLRNTVVGLQQVDQSLIEAARGMGMTSRQTLFRVEIPLAVPVIVAGLRVALVLNVGTATLASYIGAGGLGELVQQALRLNRINVLLVAGGIIAALALLIDWLAGVVERIVVARSG